MELSDRTPFRLGYTFEFGRTEADAPALCVLFNRCDARSQEEISKLASLGVAILPEGMSRERFEWLERWCENPAEDVIRTFGT